MTSFAETRNAQTRGPRSVGAHLFGASQRAGYGPLRLLLFALSLALHVAGKAENPNSSGVGWSAPKQVALPLKMENGLPIIVASINGTQVPLILDTGSQQCLMEGLTAQSAQVRLVNTKEGAVELAGVGGREWGRIGIADTVRIGAWEVRGLHFCVRLDQNKSRRQAQLFRKPLSFNILGVNALRSMCSFVTIDYRRSEVVFGFEDLFRPGGSKWTTHQSIQFRDGLPFVRVNYRGHEWLALVDTGATSQLEVSPAVAADMRGSAPSRWMKASQVGLGTAENYPQRFECMSLDYVSCLGRQWKKANAMLVANESKVGNGLFRTSRLTLDFKRSEVWLEFSSAPL